MYVRRMVICGAALLLLPLSTALGAAYTGTLTSGDGLVGTGDWATGSSVSWNVSRVNPTDPWTYWYHIHVQRKEQSHAILETSLGLDVEEIEGFSWSLDNSTWFSGTPEMGEWAPGPGNPDLPQNIYGLKFDLIEASEDLYFEFTTSRDPVWGDIYVKDGKTEGGTIDVTLWNTGLEDPEPDPMPPPYDQSVVDDHILVPDTTFIIPEPLTMLGVFVGVAGVAGYVRKRRRA